MDVTVNSWAQVVWAQVWQLTALILAVWLTVRVAARNRPHLASVLWLVVLIKCVTPPLWSSPCGVFSWLQLRASTQEVHPFPDPHVMPAARSDSRQVHNLRDEVVVEPPMASSIPDLAVQSESTFAGDSTTSRQAVPAVVWEISFWGAVLWFAGSVGFAAVASLRWLSCWRRLRRAGEIDVPGVNQLAERLRCKLGLLRPVRVIVSCSPVGPAVVGMVRPTVILPALIVQSRTLKELEPLLAHELIHIRRGDLWIGLWQLLAQGLWWFHPLVRLANNLLTREAERCCDEEVIAYLGCEPADYARSLVDVLALKRTLYAVPAFPGVRPVDVTSQRLERIMKLGQGCHKRTPRWCWIVMLLSVAVTVPGGAYIVASEEPPSAVATELPQAGHVESSLATFPRPAEPRDSIKRTYPAQDILEQMKQEHGGILDEVARVELVRRIALAAKRPAGEPEVIGSAASWRFPQTATIAPVVAWAGDTLDVTCSKQGQSHVEYELKRLRDNGWDQISVRTQVVTGPAAEVATIRVQWTELGGGPQNLDRGALSNEFVTADQHGTREEEGGQVRGHVETVVEKRQSALLALGDATIVKAIDEKVRSDHKSILFHAPVPTVYNGQSVAIEDHTKRPFIIELPRTALGLPPHRSSYFEGWFLQCRPKLQTGNEAVHLDLSLLLQELVNVKSTNPPLVNDLTAAIVEVPETVSTRIRSRIRLPLDQTLLIGGLTTRSADGKSREPMLILVKLLRLNSEPADPPEASASARPKANVARVVKSRSRPDPLDQQLANLAKDFADWEKMPRHGRPTKVYVNPNTLETRVYNVADLVIPIPKFSQPSAGNEKSATEAVEPRQPRLEFDSLLELITKHVEPKSWDVNGGRGSAKPNGPTISLVIKQTPAVHDQIARLLERMRTFQDLQVSFQVESIRLTNAEVEQWLEKTNCPGVQKLKTGTGGGVIPISSLATTWIRKLCGAGVQTGPKVTLMNGQQSEIPLVLLDRKSETCISALHLLPIVSPTFEKLHINVTVGQSGGKPASPRMDLVALQRGEALLVDVAEQRWTDANVNIHILDQLPYLGQVFRSSPPAAQTGSRQFYLISPKILLVQEYELHD